VSVLHALGHVSPGVHWAADAHEQVFHPQVALQVCVP
jgi:hypothetical protein